MGPGSAPTSALLAGFLLLFTLLVYNHPYDFLTVAYSRNAIR